MKGRFVRCTWVLWAFLVMSVVLGGCGINGRPGEGEKIGQIVKVNKEGIVSDTWEAQLIRGGLSDGSGSFGTKPFDFTIESDTLAKKASEYMEKQTVVLIKYRVAGVYGIASSRSGGVYAVSIEPAPK